MLATDKRLLQPYADLFGAVVARIEGLEDGDLLRLIDAARSMTTTNCGWATYRAAQIILGYGPSEIWRRERKKLAETPALAQTEDK